MNSNCEVENIVLNEGATAAQVREALQGNDKSQVAKICETEEEAIQEVNGLKNVKTIDGKFYVYASDVEKITSITAGGKTYVGQLIESGSKLYDWDNGKTTTMYTGTFFEGSCIDITGVVAEDAAYDGQSHQGYKGTISNSGGYTGEYTITYTGGSTDGTFNVHAEANSPTTGDNSNMFLWIVLLFISGGTVITLIGIDKKRRSAVKK